LHCEPALSQQADIVPLLQVTGTLAQTQPPDEYVLIPPEPPVEPPPVEVPELPPPPPKGELPLLLSELSLEPQAETMIARPDDRTSPRNKRDSFIRYSPFMNGTHPMVHAERVFRITRHMSVTRRQHGP
jgi:hypothetical protein